MSNKDLYERLAEYARKEMERHAQPTMTFKINKNLDIAKAALPDGYVIVPVEPTEAMQNVLIHYPSSHPVDVYKAILQAAQEEE